MTPACPRCEADNPTVTGHDAKCRRCGKRWKLAHEPPKEEPQAYYPGPEAQEHGGEG